MIPPSLAPIQRRIGLPKVDTLPGSLIHDGALAQLGERLHGMQEVSGSIPLGSTITFYINVLETDLNGVPHK